MSAITGIFMRNGKELDPQLMKKMNDKLSHRGPDGSSIWCEGSIGLGHQMLWTTQESIHEVLPLEEDGLVITADARIDNRADLCEELGIRDEEDVSDSYFILKAYVKWGEDCPDKLLGDFAFVVWDKQEEKLFCARDHMGVKPFYYYLDDDMFVFGTEIKALFEVEGVPREINELQIAYHLSLMHYEREITSYQNIIRLPAASYLKVDNNNLNFEEYWELDINYKIHLDSDEEYEKKFLELLTEAVKCRLRSKFHAGSMLSGGLDSSSVSCIANIILKKQNRKLKTFSATFDSVPESNERYFIEKVLSSDKFDYYLINADEIGPLNEINSYFKYGDQLIIFPNTFMTWNINREAKKQGVRILLDGLEGDIVVSHGKGFLKDLAVSKRWKKLIIESLYFSKKKNVNIIFIYLNIIIEILFSKIKFLDSINNYQEYKFRKKILEKKFVKKISLKEKIIDLNNGIDIHNAKDYHYYSLKSGLIQYGMESTDWMSAAFFLESRHPFYDKRLIEFCLAIPTEQKISKNWDRYIMRRAMSNILPKEVQWREKKGNLGHNHSKSMIKYNKKLLNEVIFEKNYSEDKYVDIKKIKKIYTNLKNGNKKEIIFLWQYVILSLWLRKFS